MTENLWDNYKLFVSKAILSNSKRRVRSFDDWQANLFTNIITYAIPLSFIALVPSIMVVLKEGLTYISVVDVLALSLLVAVTLNKRINVTFRKFFVVAMFYLLAIFFTEALGSFGIGAIYILAISVFIAIQFKNKISYLAIVVNSFVYTAFSAVIYFKLFNSPLIIKYDTSLWIGYSFNLLFINLIIVMQIRQLIHGFEGTLIKEANIRMALKEELEEKRVRTRQLKESEEHYKTLFYYNPSPMWIYDIETLQFLQVNNAAVEHYGYSAAEFKQMTIKDIRSGEDIDELLKMLEKGKGVKAANNVTRHRCKNGKQFYVEVRCSTIPFNGKKGRLVIARNITSQIKYTQAIKKQNEQLQNIAFKQSHIVRAPLARIMGISDLMKIEEVPDPNLITYLDISVKELDDVIRNIINDVAEVNSIVDITKNPSEELAFIE